MKRVGHRRRFDLFAANRDGGALGLDGKMLDIPHLKQAQKTLAMHSGSNSDWLFDGVVIDQPA